MVGNPTLDGGLARYCGWTALGGATGWLAVVGHLGPSPFEATWARALLLLAPMALVPMVLALVPPRAGEARATLFLWRAAVVAVLPAALALVAAHARPQGAGAAALATPWLGVTGAVAGLGLIRVGSRWRRDRALPLSDLAVDAGLVYLAVGGRAARAAAAAVIAGVPLVAAGITVTQLGLGTALEGAAAWVTALAGLLSASLHLRLAARPGAPAAARALWSLAGVALAASMVLAGLYGTRAVAPVAGLDIPRMRALHGSANALGFALAGVLGWVLAGRGRGPDRPP